MPGRPAAITAGTCLAIVLGVLSGGGATVRCPGRACRGASSVRGRASTSRRPRRSSSPRPSSPGPRTPPCTRVAQRSGMDGARRRSPGSTGHASISPRAAVRPSTPRSWRWTVTQNGRLWAVGYARTPSTLRPLVVRKSPSGGWREVDTPRRRAGATLTDVGSDGTAGTWAVGYAIGKPGRHAPWALRWDGRSLRGPEPRARER